MNGTKYVIWAMVDEETGKEIDLPPDGTECEAIGYAHALLEYEDGAKPLYTTRAGSGRIIESDVVYRNRSDIPLELYPAEYLTAS